MHRYIALSSRWAKSSTLIKQRTIMMLFIDEFKCNNINFSLKRTRTSSHIKRTMLFINEILMIIKKFLIFRGNLINFYGIRSVFYTYFNKLLPWNTKSNLSQEKAKSYHKWTYLKTSTVNNTLYWKSRKALSTVLKNKVFPLSLGIIRNIGWLRVTVMNNFEFTREESVILGKKWIFLNGEIKFASQL